MTGWEYKSLATVCEILDSRRRPVTKKDRRAGEYPYYGATGIVDYVDAFIFDEPLVLVGEDGAKWGSGEGTAFSVSGRYWVNNHAHVLRPIRARLLDGWLVYYLVHQDLSPFVSGLTVPKLNQGNLREIPVPLPPVAVQRHIVAILDEAFEGIATAKASAEENLKNARELFISQLEWVFSKGESNWRRVPLESLGVTQTGSTPKSSEPENLGDYLPFVKPGDFNRDGSLTYDNEGLSMIGAKKARRVQANSALMVCIGATIGKAGFSEREIATNQQVNSWTPTTDTSAKFIYYQMTSSDFQLRVRQSAGQATLPIINKSKWSALTVVIPPTLDEQLKIVADLDALLAESMNLEAVYERKLAALDELRNSLMHQAFSGGLTAKSTDKRLEAVT
jgi:type I restriction enzyme S subunit